MVKIIPSPSNTSIDPSKSIPITGEVIFEDENSFRVHSSYETFLKTDFSYERVP